MRLTENQDSVAEMRSGIWAPNWPHEKPDTPFTTAEAHAAWQTHKDCGLECARKQAALGTLVAAGVVVLDTSRAR